MVFGSSRQSLHKLDKPVNANFVPFFIINLINHGFCKVKNQ